MINSVRRLMNGGQLIEILMEALLTKKRCPCMGSEVEAAGSALAVCPSQKPDNFTHNL